MASSCGVVSQPHNAMLISPFSAHTFFTIGINGTCLRRHKYDGSAADYDLGVMEA